MTSVKEWTRQRNKIESSKVGPYEYSQLIFDKEQMQFGERIFFSTNGTGTIGHPCLKKKINFFLSKFHGKFHAHGAMCNLEDLMFRIQLH